MTNWTEMDVKDYIASHSDELLGEPLLIVNREVAVGSGGFADLIAMDGNLCNLHVKCFFKTRHQLPGPPHWGSAGPL